MVILYKSGILGGCWVVYFKQQFSVFKQHYTYFHTFFHPHIFPKKYKQLYQNNITKQTLDFSASQQCIEVVMRFFDKNIKIIFICNRFIHDSYIYIYIYKTEVFDFWLTSLQFSTSTFFIYIFQFDLIPFNYFDFS